MSAHYNIPFHKPTFIGNERGYIQEAIDGGNWTKVSEDCRAFFDGYYGGKPCLFTNSCSSALEMAIRALGIGEGDEVIVPGFSYVALANAVVNNGAVPVFADVNLPDGNIDVKSAAACITSKTKAIIALHYAGSPCDIKALVKLCHDNHIYFIEDAAQCIGSNYDDKPLGSFGQIGCLSFDYMKNISCGQGGLLVINDVSLLQRIQTVFDNGTDRFALLNGTQKFFEWVGKGSNYQINPLASYFLYGQLKAIKAVSDDRLAKWNLYQQMLLPLAISGRIKLNNPSLSHNGHIFYIITASEQERYNLRNYLRELGIFTEHHYSSLAESPFGKKFISVKNALSSSEKLCGCVLRLPLWYGITEGDINAVVSSIFDFYAK